MFFSAKNIMVIFPILSVLLNRSICLPEKENNEVNIVIFLATIFWLIKYSKQLLFYLKRKILEIWKHQKIDALKMFYMDLFCYAAWIYVFMYIVTSSINKHKSIGLSVACDQSPD